jgi:hypothetical protein
MSGHLVMTGHIVLRGSLQVYCRQHRDRRAGQWSSNEADHRQEGEHARDEPEGVHALII